ncbi:hypothetical protein TRSC58_07612 [Trypanosoma rangeli SC58]|uniref:Uncharacterized protein n=1 Tax=Trypanosoma rangeli SC58 TaxID=429131 RepID=A0A061IUV9_TRYRA|nr:hypothetical protein TRSC58_07612 [Trypanosoma rangeli SC58]
MRLTHPAGEGYAGDSRGEDGLSEAESGNGFYYLILSFFVCAWGANVVGRRGCRVCVAVTEFPSLFFFPLCFSCRDD